jgi:hypothetical protein
MEKRGDISSATPQPGKKTEKQAAADQLVKASPTNKRQADKMEDGPMARVSDAAADAAKKK